MKKSAKFDLAHFNPEELKELDAFQGGRIEDENGIPRYDVLESMLSKPMNMKYLEGCAAKKRCDPKMIAAMRHMTQHGRHGDTAAAMIGPVTRNFLDRSIGGPCLNPVTGKREYFLGGVFNKIGSGVANVAKGAVKTVGQVGNQVMQAAPGMLQTAAKGYMATNPAMMAARGLMGAGRGMAGQARGAIQGATQQAQGMMGQAQGMMQPQVPQGQQAPIPQQPMQPQPQSVNNYPQQDPNQMQGQQ